MLSYQFEREGQIAFFDNFGIPYNDDNSILIDNTDGVYNGILLEFKLHISNINAVLFQAIKYLSKMRVKGESVPATILLVSLNDMTAYLYHSKDYFDDIHKLYVGAASKGNEGFIAKPPIEKFDYSDIMDAANLKKLLKGEKTASEMYMPIDIDENCIVGWAERYYSDNPTASKGDFLGDDTGVQVKLTGEIREPKVFADLINPYTGKTNEKFKYLMDCLNDRLSKKDLGAFYTPKPYAKKAAELVMMAVDRVPEGNDYIILDRCAGTGNLEEALIGLYDKHGDELISHCVVSTYEYYEYKVLIERIGDKVRDIIPPTEANVVYSNGRIANADAMSEEYINNPIIKQYVDDPECTIILFENPPYRDMTVDHSDNAKRKGSSHVVSEAKKHLKGSVSNDLANLFIWSGFNYYLRQATDSYIVFSPVKYYKTDRMIQKCFISGFVFNRKHFHATESAISCILWGNSDENKTDILLNAYDINDQELVPLNRIVDIKQCIYTPSKLYDKTTNPLDSDDGICCSFDGTEHFGTKSIRVKKLYNQNIIGYLKAKSFNFDAMNRLLVRCGEYDANGCFIRTHTYLRLLPLWASKMTPMDNWWEKGTIATTSDGGDAYTHDPIFLKRCLIYTCLSNQNKCLSFNGSDGRYYRNELCFDTTHGDTVASTDLTKFRKDPATALDKDEQELLTLWGTILSQAKATKGYDTSLTYGVYQITKELNTWHEEGNGRAKKKVYDYPELNGNLITLRTLLKAYYKSHITDLMFEYQLLK